MGASTQRYYLSLPRELPAKEIGFGDATSNTDVEIAEAGLRVSLKNPVNRGSHCPWQL